MAYTKEMVFGKKTKLLEKAYFIFKTTGLTGQF